MWGLAESAFVELVYPDWLALALLPALCCGGRPPAPLLAFGSAVSAPFLTRTGFLMNFIS